jgi:hypothetical protein
LIYYKHAYEFVEGMGMGDIVDVLEAWEAAANSISGRAL